MQNRTGLERRKTDRVGNRAGSGIRALFGAAMAALLLWPLVSVTALGASGEPVLDWAINTKTSTTQWPGPVTMDPAGNIVVTGQFRDTVTLGGTTGITLTTGHNYAIYVARYRPDGSPEWAVSAGGPDWMYISSIAVKANGESVVSGSYRNAITFGEGTDAVILETGSLTTWGHFLARYRSDGTLDWVDAVPGFINDVALDDEGDVFIAGSFAGQVTFGSGLHAVTLDSDPGATWPRSAVLLARYGADGTFAWAKNAGQSNGGAGGNALSVRSDGSIFVTGAFSSGFSNVASSITLGTGEDAVTLTSSGSQGSFLAKFSENGSLVWARGSSGTAQVGFRSIAVDADGHVFVGGYIGSGVATFGEITIDKPYYLEPTYCAHDLSILLLRYKPNGDVDWAVSNEPGPRYYEGEWCDWMLSPSQANVTDIALTSDGDPLLAGYFYGQVVFGEGDEALVRTAPDDGWTFSAFLARYRADGTLAWLTTPAGGYHDGRNVASDSADNIVFAGGFGGTTTFSSGGATASLTASSGGAFLARFKPQSEVRTVACMGFESPADRDLLVRRANRVIPLSITLLDGNQFVTGGEIAAPLVSRAYQGSGNLVSGGLDELTYRGKGDGGNRFQADGSGWVFNLSTDGFSKGTHTITVGSGDSSQYMVEPTCSVQVVIQ
jgi:hypothetical protein